MNNLNILLVLLFVCGSLAGNAQSSSLSYKVEKLLELIEEEHFQPKDLDDKYSELVFDKFISLLDGPYYFLTKEDVAKLNQYKLTIDDQIKAKSLNLISPAKIIFTERIASLVKTIELCKPVSACIKKTGSDFLNLENRIADSELQEKWNQNLAYFTLFSYFQLSEESDRSYDNLTEKFAENFNQVRNSLLCKLAELSSMLSDDTFIEDSFLKSVAYGFDPHTEYFPAEEKTRFTRSLASSNFSFGFGVTQNLLGEVEIDYLYPGGPAWKSNVINEGDVIIQISSKRETYVLECGNLSAAFDMISNETLKKAFFKLRKKNGKVVDLSLSKEELEQVSNSVNGYLLSKKNDIGYIYLPSFYTSGSTGYWDITETCSADLIREIMRMKRKNISGLILDLRNNGGGSMTEALAIAGAFVDKGALSIISQGEEVSTLKDRNRGVSYEGPMIVLVNEASASASELVAGTLQDHGRAVIVGQTTFGKATMQHVLPLESIGGSVKLTSGVFFRITGETHQGNGIQPDILLNTEKERKVSKEADFSSCLAIDRIVKKTYYEKLETGLTDSLILASKDRTTKQYSKRNQKESGSKNTPTSFDNFAIYYNQIFNEVADENSPSLYKVSPLTPEQFSNPDDSSDDKILAGITADPAIQESFLILNELIKLK